MDGMIIKVEKGANAQAAHEAPPPLIVKDRPRSCLAALSTSLNEMRTWKEEEMACCTGVYFASLHSDEYAFILLGGGGQPPSPA
jgi:hypothetical protein